MAKKAAKAGRPPPAVATSGLAAAVPAADAATAAADEGGVVLPPPQPPPQQQPTNPHGTCKADGCKKPLRKTEVHLGAATTAPHAAGLLKQEASLARASPSIKSFVR